MFLKSLHISDSAGNLLRTVVFRKGLNIVLGVNNVEQGGSTNNIGKTTLMRAIDFCLDGKIAQFYEDSEFKSKNEDVFNFLQSKKPTFQLVLSKRFDSPPSSNLVITRMIGTKEHKGQIIFSISSFINDDHIDSKNFAHELKKVLFESTQEKPTFRQLIPKFIRKDEQQISNILKFLFATVSDKEYEKVHFILFGFKGESDLQLKHEIEVSLKKQTDIKKALASNISVTDIEQILLNNAAEISSLQTLRDGFRIDEKYEAEEQQLTQIQNSMREIERQMSDKFLEISLIRKNIEQLETEYFTENTKNIEAIYAEAALQNIALQKKFEETVAFNNSMLSNQKRYLENRLRQLNQEQESSESQRSVFANEYSLLLEKLSKQGSLAEYTQLNEKLESLSVKYGQNKAMLEEIKAVSERINVLESSYEQICATLQQFEKEFKDNITIFNRYFSEYSESLYGERYLLSYKDDVWPRKFHIIDTNGNFGSGKKQAIVAAFDLAYINFINEVGLPYPKFVTHDKIELVDKDKLEHLFDISNLLNGQYIVPIISDKYDSLMSKYEDNVILQLSESSKFFNIENSNLASIDAKQNKAA